MTTLLTDRLLLRPLTEADIPALLRELSNYSIVKNTARIPYPYTEEAAKEFLGFVKSQDQLSLTCAIERKEEPGVLIGIISCEWNAESNAAELGYWLSESHWQKGFASEAARAVAAHAFEVIGHPRLTACFHDGNVASGRILERLGFEPIGVCTQFSRAQGKEVPVTNLHLTKDKWRGRPRKRPLPD